MNYYNENNPNAAAWIKQLIAAGLVPDGTVDQRSICEVQPGDLSGFTQCHFFAGIAGWPLALKLAGWPEGRQVWTGSCPCQPLSCAGKQLGEKDERHLWPELYRLVSECRPECIFGEQVANPLGREWVDGISLDLEELGYAVAPGDIPASCVGAPHIRQRLFWVADSRGTERQGGGKSKRQHGGALHAANSSEPIGLVQPYGTGSQPGQRASEATRHRSSPKPASPIVGLVNSEQPRLEGHAGDGDNGNEPGRVTAEQNGSTAPASRAGDWSEFDIVHCTDGKARRIESGTFPLAPGLPKGMVYRSDTSVPINPKATQEGRVMRLHGYGNAIVPQVAAQFVRAFLDISVS